MLTLKGMALNRRRFLRSMGYSTLGLGGMVAGGYFYGTRIEIDRLRLERVTIPIRGLGSSMDGLKIAMLGDFHLYPTTTKEEIQAAVDLANSTQPDLAVLLGDYVQERADAIFDLAPILAQLNPRLGIFSILGNHDHWKGVEVVIQGLKESGLPVLRNSGHTLSIGNRLLYLAGVDDGWEKKDDLKAAMDGMPSEALTVCLMHEPDFADQFSADPRIALQLSGHSHGGQIRIPLYGAPFLPPYGRKYDQGLYRVRDMRLYTNVGIGVTAPIRLNCPPEVTEVTLVDSRI